MPSLSDTRWYYFLIGLAALAGLVCLLPEFTEPDSAPPPRLAVLVFFDQLRGDYLGRWDKLFGEEGFRRLETEGAWFQDCHYPYAYTVTATGHSSVAAGCLPDRHGIVANEWYDRTAREEVYCVSSERYHRVPAKAGPGRVVGKRRQGVSPERLLQPTLADALKAATQGKGKVVSLSMKDRSAVLPGGRRPDACYWFDLGAGEFVTSTYYRERLHPWAADYNKTRPADAWLGKDWTRLRGDLDYERYSGPDDAPGESKGPGQGRTFPHPMGGKSAKSRAGYYAAVYNSPFGNDLLLGLVKRAVEAEKLGSRDVPDLLSVSFSSNDVVGHAWGPDSQEVLDMTLRHRPDRQGPADFPGCDRGRRALRPGPDGGPRHLSAAGGGCQAGQDGGKGAAGTAHDESRGVPGEQVRRQGRQEQQTAVDRSRFRALGLSEPGDGPETRRQASRCGRGAGGLAAHTEGRPGGLHAHPAFGPAPKDEDDPMWQSVRNSFYADRSGDLFVVLKPYYLLSSPLATGTNHGTPHDYDTHVPLLVFGPGVEPGPRKEPVSPLAAAAILAKALGIEPPAGATSAVPDGLFK